MCSSYTRGAEFSRSTKELFIEAKQLVTNGAKEIYLLGQNVNAYNFERNKLSDLILKISEIKDLKRIRYTTSHPRDFTEDLIKVHENCKKLMPLIHLPVQSGSDKILKAMNRKHTIEEYKKIIEKLKKAKPGIKFSSDFIIGYPGESKKDFEETLKLIKDIGFINSYSFKYSARPGTPAFNLTKIDDKVAKERLFVFQNVAEKIKINYKKSLKNRIVKVLFENRMKNKNKYFGRDEYLNPVVVECDDDLSGEVMQVKVSNYNQNTLFGELLSENSQKNYAA